jgi:hypothetical protein
MASRMQGEKSDRNLRSQDHSDLSSDRYHGDQSPLGSVVCPTSIR